MLVALASTNPLAWMPTKFLTNLIHGLYPTDRFEGYFGLELTTKMLALRFTHNLLLLKAGYHLDLLSGNRGPL